MFRQSRQAGKSLRVILALAALIMAGFAGAALASYVKQMDLFASGAVGPKYYAFEVASSSSHTSLAPGESADYNFTVKNYNAGGISQVPLHVLISLSFPKDLAGTGRIQADLIGEGQFLQSSDTGVIECAGLPLAAASQETHHYTLRLSWLEADISLLGGLTERGWDPQAISIRVSGYQ